MLGVERMMKRYFLVAKDVGDLTRIFCTSLEFNHAKPLDMMGRVLAPFRKGKHRDQGRARFRHRFRPAQHRQARRLREATRVNLIRMLPRRRRGTTCCSIPTRSRRSRRSLRLIGHDLRNDPEANAWFLEILTAPQDRRAHPAPDERERRARQVRARVRQDRRADAVQHVPPLHGGRAPDPRRRRHGRDRQWRPRRTSCR